MAMDSNLPLFDNPPPERRVRGLFCADDNGQLQIIAPERAIVDPAPLADLTNRALRGIPPDLAKPVCALPGFYDMPAVVHAPLKDEGELALATETPNQYLRVTGTELGALCNENGAIDAKFTEDLKPTPLEGTHDQETILDAVDRFTELRVQARLDETMHIPPLPEAAQRIIALQQDPNYDLSDLVQIIETDPPIAARIMGWANSALYNANPPARDLNDAVMRVLGFDLVFNMALGMSMGATLNLPKSHVSGASPYWLDAVYAAATAEALARQMPKDQRPNPGTCYLAGLLSNFGTLVLGHVFPPQYETICRIQESNMQVAHHHVDQHVMKLNREVIAAKLFELWQLPPEICTAVRYQYVEGYGGEHLSYVAILALSRRLMERTPLTEIECEAVEALGISRDGLRAVDDVIAESENELGQLAAACAR
jgi:HD-like signal output (HDOD) protein